MTDTRVVFGKVLDGRAIRDPMSFFDILEMGSNVKKKGSAALERGLYTPPKRRDGGTCPMVLRAKHPIPFDSLHTHPTNEP